MPGGMGGGGMDNLMSQMQKLQEEMAAAQAALETEEITVTAGGGTITVVVTGDQKIKAITIKQEVVDPDDVEMLQDLVLAAVNEALDKSRALQEERMGGLTGGLNLPPGSEASNSRNENVCNQLPSRLQPNRSVLQAAGHRPQNGEPLDLFPVAQRRSHRHATWPKRWRNSRPRRSFAASAITSPTTTPAPSAPAASATTASSASSKSRWTCRPSSARAPFTASTMCCTGPSHPWKAAAPTTSKSPSCSSASNQGNPAPDAAAEKRSRCKEILLATNPNLEGDATAMYIARLVKPLGVRVTRLAHGLPVGGDLEYADDITLSRALAGRSDL